MDSEDTSKPDQQTIANLLFSQRRESFEKAIDSICEEIVSTSYCNQLLTSDFRFRIIKNMESFIEIYLNSEREVFLSALMNQISPNISFTDDSKLAQKLNSNPQIRSILLKFALNPDNVKSLSTFTLSNHFFFEASMIKAHSLQIRTILFNFSQDFLSEIHNFRIQMKNAILHIVQQCHTILISANQQKESETSTEKVDKLNKVIAKMETSHSETEKALKAEIEQLKFHSLIESFDRTDASGLKEELKQQKEKNEQLSKEVLEKTEKLRTFYAIQADLEDKTNEAEMWKQKYKEEIKQNSEPDSDLLEQIRQLKQEKEELIKINDDLSKTNSLLTQENQTMKNTISDKNNILKQSLACIEKLQQNMQNKDSEIASLKEQISNQAKKDNTAKLLAIIEKQKKQITKLNNELDSKTQQISDLKKDNENIQEKFASFTKIAENQIQEANSFAQKQVEEFRMQQKSQEEAKTQEEENQTEEPADRKPSEIELKAIAETIRLKTVNSELTTKNYLLQTKVDEHTTQMKKLASSFARAKEEIKETKEALSTKTSELSDCTKQINSLKIEIKEKVDENLSLTQSIRKLMKQKESKEDAKRLTALLDENLSLDAKIKELSTENENQKTTINKLKSEINPLNSQVTSLKDSLTSAKREIITLQTVKKEIQVRAATEQAELNDLNSQLLMQIDELKVHVTSLQNDKTKAETLLNNTMNEYEKEVKEITEKMEKTRIASETIIQSLETSKSRLQNELETEKNNVKLEKMKLKETLKQIDSLTSQVKIENTKRQKQCEVIIEMKEELNDYQNELQQIVYAIFQEPCIKPLNDILQEIRRLKALLEQLTDANLQQANMNDALKSKFENEKSRHKNYVEKLQSMKQELKVLKQNKNDNEAAFLSKIQNLQGIIQSNESQYKSAMNKLQSQMSQQINALQSDLSLEKRRKDDLIQKLEASRESQFGLQKDFDDSQKLIKTLQLDVENTRKEKNEISENLKITKSELSKITQLHEISDKNTQEIINKTNALQSIFTQVQSIIATSSIDDIPNTISKIKSENETSQRFIKNVKKIMKFNDDADFFVKLNLLINQQENIIKILNENGIQIQSENQAFDVVNNIKEMANNQKLLSSLSKQNQELEEKLAKTVSSTMMNDANSILSKIIKIITGEDSDQLKFPMKSAVTAQLLDLIQAYQTKNEKNQRNINYVFLRAKEAGYSGKNFVKAIDFMVANHLTSHNENNSINNI